ncbi:DUF6233 domain-containing protein [Streptomyces lavendulae]|uniref:DUF6233 domain-containing protein n=1 Tax=Streptomyces lavendulae TaxID=1914 RepID=UPI00369A1BD8
MPENSPSRLDLLRFLENVQVRDLQRTRDWIATEEQHQALETARRPAPPPPEWLIEHGIGTGRLPARVHTGQCWDTRTHCKPATADQARRALAEGVSACPHCRPDTTLGLLDRGRHVRSRCGTRR